MEKSKKLHKSISFITAFSIASGAMISSGLFVLPGIVYSVAGPSIILAYFLAGVLMIPTMFVQSELATAMPKAGGDYFYIMRILGPQAGLIAGVTSWFSVALKSAFALVGIGTFLTLIYPETTEFQIRLFAAGAAIVFTLLNLLSTKHSGRLQNILLFSLLVILGFFVIGGYPKINFDYYNNFFTKGNDAFFAAIGMIFISYGGLTKIASMSEEIQDSAKNLPRAMFLAFIVMNLFYILVVSIVVGVLPHDILMNTLTPVSRAAEIFAGNIGLVITTVAAMLAFITTANAGIMAASRSPLAMGRDGLVPNIFTKLSKKHKTPYFSVLFTGAFIVFSILILPIDKLVKVASSLMLMLFIMNNLSLIIIRNIHLRNYKPSFKAPFYPYAQFLAIIFYLLLLNGMGTKIVFMALFFIIFIMIWYYLFVKGKDFSNSALIMLAHKIMDKKMDHKESIDEELFEILQDREEINEDHFDQTIKNGLAFDLKEKMTKEEFFKYISEKLEPRLKISAEELYKSFNEREKLSNTNISQNLAIPHIIIEGENIFDIAIVRSKEGIIWEDENDPVKAVFVLIGSRDRREQHLRSLMAVAQLVQEDSFFETWLSAHDEKDLKNTLRLMPRQRR